MPGKQRSAHPTISDVAYRLAGRSSPPQSKVSLARNAKGDVQIAVEVGDTDATAAAQTASDLFDGLCAQYPLVEGPFKPGEPPK